MSKVAEKQLDLSICGAADVVEKVHKAAAEGKPYDLVISLEHPCDESTTWKQGRAPRLANHAGAEWQNKQHIFTCWDLEKPAGEHQPPSRQLVEEALRCYDDHKAEKQGPMKVLIHCRSGKARSAALGLVLLRHEYGAGAEQASLDELLHVRDIVAPNMAIVEHGDAIMGCGGALVQAVQNDHAVSERRRQAEAARARQIESGLLTGRGAGRGRE